MSKICSCGAHFQLHVELAVHRQKTGHGPQRIPEPPTPTVTRSSTQNWTKTAIAGVMLMSLLGLTAGLNLTVRTYTSWQCTANVLLLP
ncbi:hypothetical protein IV102_25490 [bacterium]|nr:hypothetical protein [bacterium]